MSRRADSDAVREGLTRGLAALRAGQAAQAIAPLRAAQHLAPHDANVLHLLATALGQTGALDEARQLVRRAIKQDATRAAFHDTHGNILRGLGDSDAAMRAYARALQLEPRLTGARFNLGNVHFEAGRLEDACDAFDRVLAQQPAFVPALIQRGETARRLGDVARAREFLVAAIHRDPYAAAAHRALGALYLAAGDVAAAESSLSQAVQLEPKATAARVLLARAVQQQGRPQEALAALGDLSSDSAPELFAERARIVQSLGRLDAAIDDFRRALSTRHDAADAAGLAETLLWQDDAVAAMAALDGYDDDDAPQVALARARLVLSGERDTAACQRSVRALNAWRVPEKNSRLGAALRRQIEFCLGDLLHKTHDVDGAFEHYARANAIARRPYDVTAHRRFVDALIAFHDRERVASLPRTNACDVGPVFIVGMPRSGTSLVEQILGRHPQVCALGERSDIAQLFGEIQAQEPWTNAVARTTPGQLNAMAQRYLAAIPYAADARWITDKMPLNALYLGWIAQVFPRARVVHCQRDPEAVALSCFRQDFLDPTLAFADDLETLASVVHDIERVMAHWVRVLPLPVTAVSYEALVDDFDNQVRALLGALDLAFDPACLSFERATRFVNTASHAQVRRGLYRNARDRHVRYAAHLKPFRLALDKLRGGQSA